MSVRPRILLALAVAASGALTGCGVGPYGEGSREKAPPAEESSSLDYGSTDAPSYVDADPEKLGVTIFSTGLDVNRSAEQTAAAYGLVYGNWSWSTFPDQHEEMSKLATGRLRRQLLRSPPDPELIESLTRSEQMNTARLVATDTVASDRTSRTVIVVMKERSLAGNLADPAGQHVVYRAEVVATTAGWRLAEWALLLS